jgi:hypothetical protein
MIPLYLNNLPTDPRLILCPAIHGDEDRLWRRRRKVFDHLWLCRMGWQLEKKGSEKDVYHETGNLYGENECQLGDLGVSYLYLSFLTIEKLHET